MMTAVRKEKKTWSLLPFLCEALLSLESELGKETQKCFYDDHFS
jgi:hypothetical protein